MCAFHVYMSTRLSRTEMRRAVVPAERIERSILVLRGHKVLLDADLAKL